MSLLTASIQISGFSIFILSGTYSNKREYLATAFKHIEGCFSSASLGIHLNKCKSCFTAFIINEAFFIKISFGIYLTKWQSTFIASSYISIKSFSLKFSNSSSIFLNDLCFFTYSITSSFDIFTSPI